MTNFKKALKVGKFERKPNELIIYTIPDKNAENRLFPFEI